MKLKKFFLLIFLVLIKNSYSKNIIWDLGYTLIKPNKIYIAKKMGLGNSIDMYTKFGRESKNLIEDSLFDLLREENENVGSDIYWPHAPSGDVLPKKYCDWLKGDFSCNEIKKLALKRCTEYKNFAGKSHKILLQKAIEWMFDAKTFAQCMRPIRGTVKIVEECANIKDKNGKPVHSLYILSNWDPESFKFFCQNNKNKCIFKHFKPENIFISGKMHDLKPRPSIFKTLLKETNLDPKDCIFIDDQEENLKTAKELGFTVILVKKNNFKEIREKLENLGVLPKNSNTTKVELKQKSEKIGLKQKNSKRFNRHLQSNSN